MLFISPVGYGPFTSVDVIHLILCSWNGLERVCLLRLENGSAVAPHVADCQFSKCDMLVGSINM